MTKERADIRIFTDYLTTYKPESISGDFEGKHIISVEQFSREDLDKLFSITKHLKNKILEHPKNLEVIAKGKILAVLFFEPSTRTDLSFQSAMTIIGGSVISASNGVDYSSVYKGENLADTIRTVGCYSDVIVLRHPEKGSSYQAAHYLDKLNGRITLPTVLISGGDGVGEHPTQALLDLFTILDFKGHIDGLNITMVGDLLNGRTVHSLTKLIALYNASGVTINLVSPDSLKMPDQITSFIAERNITVRQSDDLDKFIGDTDVIYWTRVQEERFEDKNDYLMIKDDFVMTPEVLSRAKADAILMHPLPRKDEMGSPEDHDLLDEDRRSVYFNQMENGMFVRMALLAAIMGKV